MVFNVQQPACCVGVGCVTRGPQVSAHGPMMLHILVITSPGPGPPRTLASRARLYKFLLSQLGSRFVTLTRPGGPSLSVRSGRSGAARLTSVPGRVPPPPLMASCLASPLRKLCLPCSSLSHSHTRLYSHAAFLPCQVDNTDDILLLRPPGIL